VVVLEMELWRWRGSWAFAWWMSDELSHVCGDPTYHILYYVSRWHSTCESTNPEILHPSKWYNRNITGPNIKHSLLLQAKNIQNLLISSSVKWEYHSNSNSTLNNLTTNRSNKLNI
jgi:hypothetical protein